MSYFQIVSASPIPGTTNRWRYSLTSAVLKADGQFETPTVLRGETGQVLTAGIVYGYNLLEANNTATGIQGNGFDLDELPPILIGVGFALRPAPVGAVVKADKEGNDWLFSYPNAMGKGSAYGT